MNTNLNERAKTRRRIVKERVDQARREPHPLPDLIAQKQEDRALRDKERLRLLADRFEQQAAGNAQAEEYATAEAGPVSGPIKPSQRNSAPSRAKTRIEHLDGQQHVQLRSTVEHLWSADERLKTWTLLAKAAGLGSGQAVKRAYEVNSSLSTLRNLRRFAELHATFGSRATSALKAGVAVEDLRQHLANSSGQVQGQPDPDQKPTREHSYVAGEPAELTGTSTSDSAPTVDFAALLEAGKAVDKEIDRLGRVAEFFDGISQEDSYPASVRASATRARKRVVDAMECFHLRQEEPPA